jgi:O-antigen/teichoic acid export membrane protein
MTSEATSPQASTVAAAAAEPKHGWLHRIGGKAVSRIGWGLADQAVSSLTNFAVSFYLAHTLVAAQFGAFSITYATYGFALTTARGLTTDPLVVRYSGVEERRWRRATSWASGTAIVLGMVTGTIVLVLGIFIGGTVGAGFFALGLTLPGLVLQDCWRFCFFAAGRGGHAFLNDSIWGVTLVPGILILRFTGHTSVFWVVLIWGLTACIAAAFGPVQAKTIPNVMRMWTWLYLHRDLGPRYTAEGALGSGANQVKVSATSGLVGLAAAGWLQAGATIFGPMNVLFGALGLITIPEGARMLRRSPSLIIWFCIVVAGGVSAIAAVWGLTLLIGLPLGLGAIMLGPIWHPTYPLVLPLTIALLGTTTSLGPTAMLHALGAARRSLRLVILQVIVSVVFAVVGAAAFGAPGVAWGSAASAWVASITGWWQLGVALRLAELPQAGVRGLIARLLPNRPARPAMAAVPARGAAGGGPRHAKGKH